MNNYSLYDDQNIFSVYSVESMLAEISYAHEMIEAIKSENIDLEKLVVENKKVLDENTLAQNNIQKEIDSLQNELDSILRKQKLLNGKISPTSETRKNEIENLLISKNKDLKYYTDRVNLSQSTYNSNKDLLESARKDMSRHDENLRKYMSVLSNTYDEITNESTITMANAYNNISSDLNSYEQEVAELYNQGMVDSSPEIISVRNKISIRNKIEAKKMMDNDELFQNYLKNPVSLTDKKKNELKEKLEESIEASKARKEVKAEATRKAEYDATHLSDEEKEKLRKKLEESIEASRARKEVKAEAVRKAEYDATHLSDEEKEKLRKKLEDSIEASKARKTAKDGTFEGRKIIGYDSNGNPILNPKYQQQPTNFGQDFDREIDPDLSNESKNMPGSSFWEKMYPQYQNAKPYEKQLDDNYSNLSYEEKLAKASKDEPIFRDDTRYYNTGKVKETITIGNEDNERKVTVTRNETNINPYNYAKINDMSFIEKTEDELSKKELKQLKKDSEKQTIRKIVTASAHLIKIGHDKFFKKVKQEESEDLSHVK